MTSKFRPLDRLDIERDAAWRGNDLLFRRRLVASVDPDSKYPNMWRVRLPSGHVSDMVNLTRAKDAAVCLALAELNSLKHRDSRATASPVGLKQEPVGWVPPTANSSLTPLSSSAM
jgi:hypothetical protein